MKIGVIGIGNIGSTLARKLRAVGHEVRVANAKGPDAARPFAEEIGAVATDTPGAIKEADVVILSIPLPALAKLPKDLFADVPEDVVVIDTSNYYPGIRDPQIAELDAGKTESIWVTEQIGRPIVKAFNNILAYSLAELGRPEGDPDRLAGAVAGDNVEAKRIASGIMNEVGFDPVDAGSLEESWRQQPCTPSYCCDYDAETMARTIAAAEKGKAPAIRDQQFRARMKELGGNPSHADMVAMNRSLNPLG